MLDPKLLRAHYDTIKKAYDARQFPLDALEKCKHQDEQWRQALQDLEATRATLKQQTPKGKPTPDQLAALKELSASVKQKQEACHKIEEDLKETMMHIPNILLDTVPTGTSEEDNKECRRWGDIPSFETPPLSHDVLATTYHLVDFERATKVSGSRFSIYTGWGAKLERALINFMLDQHTGEHGYREMMPPALVHANSLKGTGQLPKFESDLFKIADSELYLSPTAEVQLTNYYQNEILPESELPLKLAAYTPCFRSEAGSYGKDMKGLIRQHQFNKVELVQFVSPEHSQEALENLVGHAEKILQLLDLPYRVVILCSADVGFSSAMTYDLEVWFPSQQKYREISSCSNFLDFQARRAMIRYKKEASKETRYLHTLNGSGLAVGRTVAALLENGQEKSGIRVPKALVPYLGVEVIDDRL